jgi:hypothetical protein
LKVLQLVSLSLREEKLKNADKRDLKGRSVLKAKPGKA